MKWAWVAYAFGAFFIFLASRNGVLPAVITGIGIILLMVAGQLFALHH